MEEMDTDLDKSAEVNPWFCTACLLCGPQGMLAAVGAWGAGT